KHRQRMTSDQCQTLEAVYICDTKPNATKRHVLAQQLGMSPRTIQIWFQNKRAKAKQ
ncbi:homeobox, partial [Hesseltinella vesiculosa]